LQPVVAVPEPHHFGGAAAQSGSVYSFELGVQQKRILKMSQTATVSYFFHSHLQ
jgi:hypothetical protein